MNTQELKKINIAVIDDDRIFQVLIKTMLEENPHLKVVLQSYTGRDFLHVYREYKIDLIILDIDLPGENSLALAEQFAKECDHIPIIVFSALDHPRYNAIFYSLGIKKCIVKNHFPRLVDEISELFSYGKSNSADDENLTTNDHKLLCMICDDLSLEEKANQLFVSIEAVKKRKMKLAQKLKIKCHDVHFLKWAISHGYYIVN